MNGKAQKENELVRMLGVAMTPPENPDPNLFLAPITKANGNLAFFRLEWRPLLDLSTVTIRVSTKNDRVCTKLRVSEQIIVASLGRPDETFPAPFRSVQALGPGHISLYGADINDARRWNSAHGVR
jgi:hypothetical protein